MALQVKSNRDNVHDYFTKVKEQYPGISLDDFEKIISSAFNFFRKTIEAGHNQTINIKFLGKFIPFKPFKIKDEESDKASEEGGE